jgi:hypothetical protein
VRKLHKAVTFVAAIGVAAVVAGVGLGSASASDGGEAGSARTLVKPAVQQEGKLFYTDEQIDEVWKAITTNYPEPLPDGVTFPAVAPEFFHPGDGKPHLFQSKLPDLIAARYWRCAWLDESLNADVSARASDQAKAEEAIDLYATLPSVGTTVDVAGYEGQVAEVAKSLGVDADEAEFTMECGGFER